MEYNCKYDIKGFSDDLGLPFDEIANLYTELINEIKADISHLQNLFIQKDWETIKRIIHNIKGVSINYRITDLYEETVKIYTLLKAGDYHNSEPYFHNLYDVSEDAVMEITKYFAHKGILI